MAPLSIVFDTPDNLSTRSPSKSRPIDLVYLATQTLGDKVAELENLQAFARQARSCLIHIGSGEKAATSAAVRRLHGAANAVGAFRVLEAASVAEREGDAASLAAVGAAVIEAENFILKLCR